MTKTFHDTRECFYSSREETYQQRLIYKVLRLHSKCVNLLKRTVKDCPTTLKLEAGKKYIFCNLLWSKYVQRVLYKVYIVVE